VFTQKESIEGKSRRDTRWGPVKELERLSCSEESEDIISFWEQKPKNILAMIRELGIPTLFLTLSAAESKQPELLVMLKLILDKKKISESEALSLPYEEEASLIRRDPVTYCRYFDYKLRLQTTNFASS
jgi:hypothetical protein